MIPHTMPHLVITRYQYSATLNRSCWWLSGRFSSIGNKRPVCRPSLNLRREPSLARGLAVARNGANPSNDAFHLVDGNYTGQYMVDPITVGMRYLRGERGTTRGRVVIGLHFESGVIQSPSPLSRARTRILSLSLSLSSPQSSEQLNFAVLTVSPILWNVSPSLRHHLTFMVAFRNRGTRIETR